MTDAKPLPQGELRDIERYYRDEALVKSEQISWDSLYQCATTDIYGLLATIRSDRELLRWVAGHSVMGVVVSALADHPGSECGDMAVKLLAIVEAGGE